MRQSRRKKMAHVRSYWVARWVFALLLLCGAAHSILASAAELVEYGPAPAWVVPVKLPTDERRADDAAVKILLTDWQFRFSVSGEEMYRRSVMRIQTPQGLQALGTLTLPWNPATDVLKVHTLRISRAGQSIDLLANQTFTVLRRENSLEYAMLDGVLTAVIQPAGLQVGDVLELAFTVTRSDPVLAGTAEFIANGWPPLPIAHLRVRAVWAQPLVMHWKASDAFPGIREAHHGATTEVSASLDDAAPLLPPKGAPARYQIGRWIAFSSTQSWDQISQRLAPLYVHAAALAEQSPLQAEIARIRASASDQAARALAALRLVQEQVRYVALTMNDGALVPAPADLTWSRRFGDCKGKTALLLALLHGLDIQAEPVLVSVQHGDSVNAMLPMVEVFDHVLVRAVIDRKTYWLDGARGGDRELDDIGTFAYHSGLPLHPHTDLLQVPAEAPAQPFDDTSIQIDATAGADTAPLHAETTLRGQTALLMRLWLGNLTPEAREQALRSVWSKDLSSAKIDKVAARFDEQTGREHITMDGSMPMDWEDDKYKMDEVALKYVADYEREAGPNHDAPYAVMFPTYSRLTETIKLPQKQAPFSIEGEDVDRTLGGIEFHRRARIERGELTVVASERSVTTEIAYATEQADRKAIEQLTASTLNLRRSAVLAASTPGSSAPAPSLLRNGAALEGEGGSGALITQGNSALDAGQYDRAIETLDRALLQDPRSAMALADRGMAYMWKGDRAHATRDFDAAAALDENNAVVPRGRGMLELRYGEAAAAVDYFTASLNLEPHNVFSFLRRAEARRLVGRKDEALEDVDEAIRLDPSRDAARVLRASLLRELGRGAEGLQEAQADVAGSPSGQHLVAAARIYRLYDMMPQALRTLDEAVKQDPSGRMNLLRAAYRPRSDLAGRRADIEAALAVDPSSPRGLYQLAYLEIDSKNYSAALDASGKDAALHGANASNLLIRGIAHWRSGDSAAAARDFSEARAAATTAPMLNNLCWVLATENVALYVALGACDAALSLQPEDPHFLDSKGFALLRAKRYGDSIASYDAALKSDRLSASFYGRGIARHLKGDAAAGDEDIKTALLLDAHIGGEFADYGMKP